MTSRVEPERRRLRVLEVCGSAAGGVRAHVADCARLLAEAGHDVIVEAPASVGHRWGLRAARSSRSARVRAQATYWCWRACVVWDDGLTSSTPTVFAPVPWPHWHWDDGGRAWWSPSTTCRWEDA